ncbi:MAG: hypothetical protein IKT78_02465 [Ruminiclostridium sp.]|nr:hypothetical protein [Ruminiclostridium sp.]
MEDKAVKQPFSRHSVGKWLISLGIFLGIFLLFVLSLALISAGLITAPAAVARIIGAERFFVSDLAPLTMLFSGGFMLLSGGALILFTAGRLCPAAAAYVFRLLGEGNR